MEGVNPKDLIGVLKAPLRHVPAALIIETAPVFADGANKYGSYNWRDYPVRSTVYYEAALRHLFAWFDGEDVASDSGRSHIAHAAACLGIILDAKANETLEDDRPAKGPAAALLAAQDQTKPPKVVKKIRCLVHPDGPCPGWEQELYR